MSAETSKKFFERLLREFHKEMCQLQENEQWKHLLKLDNEKTNKIQQ